MISIAGTISTATDVDFYRFTLSQQDLVGNANPLSDLVFDIDYADGFNRADTSLAVYRLTPTPGAESWTLVYTGNGSNIAEDQPLPLSGTAAPEFSRGSNGLNDPFINAQALTSGEYLVAVTSRRFTPSEFSNIPLGSAGPRRVPLTQIVNPVTLTMNNANRSVTSPLFDLRGYSAGDLPAAYFDYSEIADNYDVDLLVNGVVQATDGIRRQTITISTPRHCNLSAIFVRPRLI